MFGMLCERNRANFLMYLVKAMGRTDVLHVTTEDKIMNILEGIHAGIIRQW